MKAALLSLLLVGCSPMLYVHGVPNMDDVEGLIRVGCPTKAGWDYLRNERNVRTYLALAFEDECSTGYAQAIGIRVLRVAFEPGHVSGTFKGPTQDQLHQVVAILRDQSLRPLAYGCLHGQDRTGIATMAHRLDEAWSREAAFREAKAHHFHPELLGLMRAWREYRP